MPFTIKLLGHGGISGAATTALFTVDANALGAIVNNVRVVNTGGSATTVNLYYKPNGGSQVRILDRDKSIPASEIVVVKPELTMGASDKIELVTVSGAAVEYVVSGMEKV
ncbi:MAG TPA: hypothetical protein VMS21_14305 [Methylomirabilota bacterium]|nr:hypothetical protein [Methylomirabilota bacterium]